MVIPYTTLLGADDQPCELAGYGPIPAELAREIAVDGVWKRLLVDPASGALLDHGRTTYRPPAALADFVRARDGGCRFPICRRQSGNCELDHAVPWAKGGVTAQHNLWTGCAHDHDLKDRSGWTVWMQPDGTIEWITPTGHHYASNPHDYRPVDDPDPPLLHRHTGTDLTADQTATPPQPAARPTRASPGGPSAPSASGPFDRSSRSQPTRTVTPDLAPF